MSRHYAILFLAGRWSCTRLTPAGDSELAADVADPLALARIILNDLDTPADVDEHTEAFVEAYLSDIDAEGRGSTVLGDHEIETWLSERE